MPKQNINKDRTSGGDIVNLHSMNLKTNDGLDRVGTITQELNPARLSNIFRESESPGTMFRLFELYHKIEKYDGKIQGLVEKRRKAPTRFETKIKKNYPDHEKTNEVCEKLENVINSMNLKKLKKSTINGILHGVHLRENVWVPDGDFIVFKDPVEISSSRFGQYNEIFGINDPRWGKLYIKSGHSFSDRTFVDDIDSHKIYKALYDNKKGFYDLSGIMRPICKWYLFKYFCFQYWIEYNETYGFPTTVLTIPKSDYVDFKDEIEEFLQNVGRNKFGILFEGMEYKVHAQQSNGQVEFFRELVKKVNDEIIFGLLGTNLAEGSSQGSYAQSVVGYDMETDLIIDDSEFVDDCINDNLIKPFLHFNWKDLPEDFVELHTNTPERKDWKKIEKKWEIAAKLGLKGVSKDQLSDELEIKFADKEEDSIDLYWQRKENTGGEHPDPDKRSEEREDGGSKADE